MRQERSFRHQRHGRRPQPQRIRKRRLLAEPIKVCALPNDWRSKHTCELLQALRDPWLVVIVRERHAAAHCEPPQPMLRLVRHAPNQLPDLFAASARARCARSWARAVPGVPDDACDPAAERGHVAARLPPVQPDDDTFVLHQWWTRPTQLPAPHADGRLCDHDAVPWRLQELRVDVGGGFGRVALGQQLCSRRAPWPSPAVTTISSVSVPPICDPIMFLNVSNQCRLAPPRYYS